MNMSEENNDAVAPEATSAPEEVQETEVTEELEASTEEVHSQEKTTEEKKQEAEVKKALKEFELKVNGKSKKVSLDLDNEEEVKKYLQKAMAADEKFQEASSYKKQAEQLVEMLQTDPLSILRNPALGLDIRKLAEQVLLEDLEEQQKSPEQKELEEYKRKLKEYEEKQKKAEDERKQQQIQEATRRNQEEIESSMIKALEASDFPAEPYFIRRVADAMASAIENGWEDVTVEKIMPYVESRMRNDFGSLINKHKDPSKFEKLVGKDVLNEYRKHTISKVKKAPTTGSQSATSTAKPDNNQAEAKPKKIRIEDIGGW
jgi:hypothetical protein